MKKSKFLTLLTLSLLTLSSCGNSLPHYDYTKDKINTNVFYQNVGQVRAADPQVLTYKNKFYLYATNANVNVDCSYLQCWTSENLTDWTNEGIVYQPSRNNWAIDGLWAPEVIEHNGTFYLYYSGWDIRHGGHKIGIATSTSPCGPFVDAIKIPLNFPWKAIDPSPFIDDDGQGYLYVTRDQDSGISSIYVAKLSDDLTDIDMSTLTLVAEPSQSWEKKTSTYWNEGPYCYKKNGKYYLFYSANYYMGRDYCVGVAVADSPMGPFTKLTSPILSAKDGFDFISGPGHCSIFDSFDKKETFIAYHSHVDTTLGGSQRKINFDRIYIEDNDVSVFGPTLSPQILPSGCGEYSDITCDSVVKVNGEITNELKDNRINNYENSFEENEYCLDIEKAEIKITFAEEKVIKAIMLYDSACYDFALSSVKDIEINGKHISNVKMNHAYFNNDEYETKIPCSAFIVEFNEITSKEITIKIDHKEAIYLNEVKVVGK